MYIDQFSVHARIMTYMFIFTLHRSLFSSFPQYLVNLFSEILFKLYSTVEKLKMLFLSPIVYPHILVTEEFEKWTRRKQIASYKSSQSTFAHLDRLHECCYSSTKSIRAFLHHTRVWCMCRAPTVRVRQVATRFIDGMQRKNVIPYYYELWRVTYYELRHPYPVRV